MLPTAGVLACTAMPRLSSAALALSLPPLSVFPVRLAIGTAEFRIAARTSATVIPGFAAASRPITPATCGVAIDVPLYVPYELLGSVE